MSGLWTVLLLVLVSALPGIFVWIWFSLDRIPVRLGEFLAALLAGILALIPAALFRSLFPPAFSAGLPLPVLEFFVRIALTEEAGRLAVFIPLFLILGRLGRKPDESRSAALGLVLGLGFATVEAVSYGASGLSIALFRAVTATPLHGLCGSRVACAVFLFRKRPLRGFFRFLGAVIIHGLFNFTVIRPGLPVFLPPLLVAAFFLPMLRLIHRSKEGNVPAS